MQKKLFGILLVLCMMFAALGICASAAEYYVDATNGLDTNAGTVDAPVQTFAAAMDKAATDAAEGVTVTVYVIGDVEVTYTTNTGENSSATTYKAYNTPECDGTIIIEGYPTESDATPSLTLADKLFFCMNGKITFKNILLNNSGAFHIVAQNHKLVMDEGTTTNYAVNGTVKNVYIYGGHYLSKATVASGDITIRSGNYDVVTIGPRQNQASPISIGGTLTIGAAEGCSVYIRRLAPFSVYGGTIGEDSTVNIVVDGAATVKQWCANRLLASSTVTGATFKVNLALTGDLTVSEFVVPDSDTASTVEYAVYASESSADDANIFVSDGTYVTVGETQPYSVYCEKYIGHKCGELCENCGTTPTHVWDAKYIWAVSADGKAIEFTCDKCNGELATVTPASTVTDVYLNATSSTLVEDFDTKTIGTTDAPFADVDLAMQYAALAAIEGNTVTVHVDGTVAIADNNSETTNLNAYEMPAYAGIIKIAGGTDASLTFGSSQLYFLSNGSLEISNIEFANTENVRIFAQSHKLFLGEKITMLTPNTVYVNGDCYYSDNTSISSDVTIRSGNYNLVSAGSQYNNELLKGEFKLTLGTAPETDDTLTIGRLAPFSVFGGTPSEDITATITVDGKVTVNNWFADRAYGNDVNNGYEYFVDLYLEDDGVITAGTTSMFKRDPSTTSSTPRVSVAVVTYNIYGNMENENVAANAALFTNITETLDGKTCTITVNKHNAADTHDNYSISYEDTDNGKKAVFKCECGIVLAEHDPIATTIYVSEDGIASANAVSSKIGTTADTALDGFETAMEYAAAAANATGETVTVNVVGAVNVPENYKMPAYANGTIKIVGTEGASLKFAGKAKTPFYSNGSLEINNIKLDNSNVRLCIVANNNKLVLGKGLEVSGKDVVIGGEYLPSTTEQFTVDSDVTILSGTYEIVTGGSMYSASLTTPQVTKADVNIVIGSDEDVTITRFAPFGVWGNIPYDANSEMNATVRIVGDKVTVVKWFYCVAYYAANTCAAKYNVDLIVQGSTSNIKFEAEKYGYIVDYNIYFDTREIAVDKTWLVSKTDTYTLTVSTVDTYYTYCDKKLSGHTVTDKAAATTAYKCDACEECGYTYHAAKDKEAVWTYDETTGEYTFPCNCGKGNLTTSEKPYVYVGGYSVTETVDETTGETKTIEEATSGTDDGMGASDSPITTIREAVRRMATTGGEVILTADRDINNDISFVAYTQPITFKSICGEDGKPLYGFVCKNLGACFNLNGPTTFEYIKFDMPGTVTGTNDGVNEWTMPMTLVFAAHWNDLTFGEGISTLGQAYVVAGTNRLSYDETSNVYKDKFVENTTDGTWTYVDDKEVKSQTITFNKVESRADAQNDNKTLTFYATIYLGDRINNITAPYVLKDKNVTAIFNDAQCGLIYSGTTASTTYATTGTDDGEEGGEVDNNTGDGTGSGETAEGGVATASEEGSTDTSTDSGTDTTSKVDPDIVQLIGCKTTIKFNGETVVYRIRTGYENTYQGSSSLDELNIYFNDNSSVTDTTNIGIVLYNVKNLNVYIPGTGDGARTTPLAQRIHGSLSDQFLAYRKAQNASDALTATATYTAHSVDVYPRFNYSYDKVTRNYENDHNFVLNSDGTAFVCEGCGGKTMAQAAMSPVVITAKPISAKDGKITVGYYYSWTGGDSTDSNYTGSTGLKYSVRERFDSFSFDVVTPAGLTLEEGSLKLNNFGSAEDVLAAYNAGKNPSGWSGAISDNKVTITHVLEGNALISNNRLVATAVFTVDDSALANFNVEKYPVENVSASNSNENFQIVPEVVYEVATKTYKQGFYLGVTLLSEYVLEYLVPVKDDISGTATWMVFNKEYLDGTVTKTETTAATPEEELKNGMWRFAVPGIAGKQMNDNISGTYYYIGTDGFIYRANTKSYNLTNYYKVAVGSASTELKAVLDAMLCYGAAAQTYFGYDENNLVTANANVTDNYAAPSLDITASYEFKKEEGTYTYVFDGQDAVLDQRIGISLYFDADSVTSETDVSGLVFNGSYKNINGSTLPIEISGDNISVVAVDEDGTVDYRIRVYIDTIAAKDLRQEFAGELYNGETKVSPTITTSFEAYASKAIADYATASPELVKLCKAILAYSDAAAGYLKITQ